MTTSTAADSLPRIGFTVDEATQILGCSEHMLRAGAAAGRYPHLSWPRGIGFTFEHLQTIAEMHEQTTSSDPEPAEPAASDPGFRYDPNQPGTALSQRRRYNASRRKAQASGSSPHTSLSTRSTNTDSQEPL